MNLQATEIYSDAKRAVFAIQSTGVLKTIGNSGCAAYAAAKSVALIVRELHENRIVDLEGNLADLDELQQEHPGFSRFIEAYLSTSLDDSD